MSLPGLFSGFGLGAALPVPRLIRPRIRTSKRLLPLRVYRRQEIGTSATLENPLSSCRHLASFAACNPCELVFVCITLRPLAGVCSLGGSVMYEVFDPGYRIRVGGLPAGWSELGRKAPELSRDDYLGKLHADMDIARTMHYVCGSCFNYEASSIARVLVTG